MQIKYGFGSENKIMLKIYFGKLIISLKIWQYKICYFYLSEKKMCNYYFKVIDLFRFCNEARCRIGLTIAYLLAT